MPVDVATYIAQINVDEHCFEFTRNCEQATAVYILK
jgi:hypothetical protein